MYELEIKDTNKFFNINNKIVRSPFKAKIPDSDVKRILSTIKCQSVINYTLTKTLNDNEVIEKINDRPENNETVYLKHVNKRVNPKKREQKINTTPKPENIEVTITDLKKKANDVVERISKTL